MANNGIFYSSGNTLNFTTNNTTWATITSGGTFVMNTVSGGTYLNLPSATFTGGTVSGATNFTGGLTANTISATTYYNVSSNFQYEIHVSQIDGNDTTGNGDLLNPVATITYALTLLTGSRKTIIVHPGTYTENVTVASGNTTIATSELTGANTLLSGTLTIGSLGSGSRISGLKMSNLVISETAQAYISNCTVDTQVIKSSIGYVEIINSEMQCISGITISGAGIIIINGNKNVGVSVSNASAQVIIKGCNSVVTPSASAGNLAIVDCIVTALGENAITITNSATTLTLLNSQVLVQEGNNVAPISVAGIYSIINTIYDKPGSTFTGTSTNSIDYFQYINADKFITQGGTSLQYVMGDGSLSNGFTGGTVSGATNFTGGLTANTISATTYQNLPQSVSGNGTTNYIPKWTGSTGLGNSQLQDDGSQISINEGSGNGSAKVSISSSGTTGIYGRATQYGIYGAISGTTSDAAAVYGEVIGGQYGVYGKSIGDPVGTYIGVYGQAIQADSGFGGTTYIGGKFKGDPATGAGYSLWLEDGTEGVGKVLVSQTSDGKANWNTFSGINITITSAATNTLVFSAATGGSGAVSSVTAGSGLSGNSTTGAIEIINTDKGSSQNIFKNIQVNGATQFSAGSNSSNLNFSGINITITSAATNTLVFSADTGGGGGGVTQIIAGTNITISPTGGTGVVTINSTGSGGTGAVSSVTAGSGLSGNSTTGDITLSVTGVTASQINNSTTVGQNLITLPNPSAISYLRINADNTVTSLTLSQLKTDLGLTQQVLSVGVTTALVNTFEDTGFSFPVTSGKYYRWKVVMSVGATNSSCFGVSGATFNSMNYRFTCQNAATTVTIFGGVANDTGTNAAFSSNGLVIGEGYINPSASGTFKLRFRSLTAGALTIRAGSSLSWEEVL
jgi:hypothetical protein